jgi:UDP-N-acetylglucosamine 2-epimerase (non-hydrolysing)
MDPSPPRIQLIIGTRPEVVHALPLMTAGLASAHRGGCSFDLVTVTQHTDPIMSTEVLPTELTDSWPTTEVRVAPFSLAAALAATQEHFSITKPDVVIVIGDTDTSLAAALAATELRVPVAHVEAGLRSHDWAMKEERNRVLIDHLSAIVFPPTEAAEQRLHEERVHARIERTGDVHVDAFRILRSLGHLRTDIAEPFLLCTVHRRENILEAEPLARIVTLLTSLPIPVHLALHPHTRLRLEQHNLMDRLRTEGQVVIGEPMAFLDFVQALGRCAGVVTDSGGVQKQAWLLDKPCATLRTSTEWRETLVDGWNVLIDPGQATNLNVPIAPSTGNKPSLFGDGFAAEKIVQGTIALASGR